MMHSNVHESGPVPGKIYRCVYNGSPLYEARIEHLNGCWATVEVVKPFPGPHEHNYRPGQKFDIRHASYEFIE